jgi:WD40-like Beta Propeller Repeat
MRALLGRVVVVLSASAVVALAAALLEAAPAWATFPGKDGYLAARCCADVVPFFAEIMPTGGLGPNVPTAPNEYPFHIAWSSDGTRVAFYAPASPATPGFNYESLWIENADGTGLHQVGRADRYRFDPAWSPDGSKLVFVQARTQRLAVRRYLYDFD